MQSFADWKLTLACHACKRCRRIPETNGAAGIIEIETAVFAIPRYIETKNERLQIKRITHWRTPLRPSRELMKVLTCFQCSVSGL